MVAKGDAARAGKKEFRTMQSYARGWFMIRRYSPRILEYLSHEQKLTQLFFRFQVEPQEKKKTPKGRARKRLLYTRRFVNVTLTGGKRKVGNILARQQNITSHSSIRLFLPGS